MCHEQINTFLPLLCKLKQNFFLVAVKIIEYFFSAVSVVSSNPCVGPSPRVKYLFFVIKVYRLTHIYCKNYYIFTKSTSRKLKRSFCIKSNTISRILYLSISAFFTTVIFYIHYRLHSFTNLFHKLCICLLFFHE